MMKKIFTISALAILFASCAKNSNSDLLTNEEETGLPSQRACASYEVLQQQLQNNPKLQEKMQSIERFTEQVAKNPSAYRLLADGTIEIPVVFNVLYKTSAQNISAAQIQSQINVLNADYAATNSDYNLTPSLFQSVRAGSTGIKFVLAGTVRKSTTKTSWLTNDAMKSSAKGGIDPTSPTTTLNIWVCNLANGILGYAQFPGGAAATDGVVLDDNATGNTGTVSAPYNKGRTATHEIGHWLNLRHIWGDGTCATDYVDDTPIHNAANYGCPTYPHKSTCTGTPTEMTMNYMDYTDDACMYMFTLGQKTRMKAVFVTGGPRNTFAQP